MVVEFIDAHKERFGVEPICAVLRAQGCGIASSTYYASKSRPPSARSRRDALVLAEIRRVHHDRRIGRCVYGARKVWRHLRREHDRGELPAALGPVPRCQVERLMRAHGLAGARRGKRWVTTTSDRTAARPADHVRRNFTAAAPNRLWVVDFTYASTWEHMAYTAFVSDVCSRHIVGWRTGASMPTELPLDALEMAIWIRNRHGHTIDGVVHHSDAGSQYTALRYTLRLAAIGAVASIGSVGDSYDNALAESVIGLYKTECVRNDGPFRTVDELELATCDWVHWFNHTRLHSSIGYTTPIDYENDYYRHNQPRQQPLSA